MLFTKKSKVSMMSRGYTDYLLSGDDPAVNTQVHKNNFKIFMQQFKVSQECTNSNVSKCWDSTGEKYLNCPTETGSWAFTDVSGRSWTLYTGADRIIFVDTNGFQKPNRWGKDRFFLWLYNADKSSYALGTPTRIVPLADSPNTANMCTAASGNKCYTEQDYFGTSWLYN